MSLGKKIAKNTAIQVAGKLAGTVLALVTAGIIFRELGDVGYGQYTKIISFLQLFAIMMDFGLYIILIKKIANLEDDNLNSTLVNNIFTLRVLAGVIFLGSAPFIALLIGQFNDAYPPVIALGVGIATLFYFFISMNQLLSAVFQKVLRTSWVALGEFLGKLVLLIAVVVVAILDLGLLPMIATLVLSSGVNFAINFMAARKYVHFHFAYDWKLWKSILKEAWPIAISIGFVLLYFKGDAVILSFYEPDQVIGWYGAPYKMLEVLVTFPAMFVGLVLPVITAAWRQKDQARFNELFQKSFDALAIISVPLIGGTLALSPMIIRVLAGSEFTQSISILNILIIATTAIYIGTLLGYVVVALDKQRQMMYGYGFIAVTSLIAYFTLIPRYSIFGAAWVTVYSEVAVVAVAFAIIIRTAKPQFHLRTFFKTCVASVGMYGVLYASTTWAVHWVNASTLLQASANIWFSVISLLILVPIGAVTYGGILLLCKAVRLSDMKELMNRK